VPPEKETPAAPEEGKAEVSEEKKGGGEGGAEGEEKDKVEKGDEAGP
jgi:hypothetical protein